MVEVQTTQRARLRDAIDAHDRRMAELKSQSESRLPKLDEKYQTLKEQIRVPTTRRPGATMADALARRHAAGGRGARTRSTARSTGYGPRWDDPAWAIAALPARRPAGGPVRRGPARPRHAARRGLGRRPA